MTKIIFLRNISINVICITGIYYNEMGDIKYDDR